MTTFAPCFANCLAIASPIPFVEPVIRARTALENEFIEPAISRETFNQCEILQKKATDIIDLITQKKIKEILGKIYFEKYINEKI